MSGNSIVNTIVKILSVAVVIISSCIGVAFFGADISLLLIMAAFMLFYVLLPGCLIIDAAGLKCDHISTFLIRGFFAGFAANILLYYITDMIGNGILLYSVCPILSVIAVIRIVRRRSERKIRIRTLLKNIPAGLFLFIALVFLYSFFTTQCTYIPPYKAAFATIKLDFGFHAGIINALAEGFPPDNPWVSGMSIYYHFFTEMLYSIPIRLFGVHSEEVLLSCTPYIITPVLCCALYSFFREFSANGKRCGFYCLALILSNMFVLKDPPSSWFLYHLFSNINNAGMGVAGMLVILPVLKAWDPGVERDSESGALKDVVFLAVMIMLTTGIKGPMAVVVVGGMIGTVLLGIILRKLSWKVIPPTIIATASFVFIYIYVVGARGVSQTNGRGGTLLNPWEVTDIFFLKGRILGLFEQRTVALAVLLLALILISLTAFVVPFVIGYIRELFLVLSGRKEFCLSKVTVYASYMVGYLALLLLNYSGHSQVYFGFASLILVPMISFWYIEDLEISKAAWAKVIKAVFILCLCLTAVTAAQDMARMAGKAYSRYENRDKESQVYRAVSSSEYEGLIWLRDNTDDDSLIASDRYYSVSLDDYSVVSRSHNTHFAYAIYSERDQYLEGSGFSLTPDEYELRREMIHNVKDMMDAGNEDRGDLARSLDVDYVLVSKRFNDVGDLRNDDYKLVYSNDEMDIYEVLDEAL